MEKKKKDLIEVKLRPVSKDTEIKEIQTLDEFDHLISELAKIGRQILQLELMRDSKIAEIKIEFQKKIGPQKKRANNVFEIIVRYAQRRITGMLPVNRKSAEFTSGVIGWQTNPPSVKLTVSEEIAVSVLKEKGHAECIRTKEVVDLEILGKNPELARSLSIVEYKDGEEYFFVKPTGVQVNFMRRMKALVEKVSEKTKPKKRQSKT